MALSAFLDQPEIKRLPQLLRQVRQGQILVPRFQRPFLWSDEQRLQLMDSIRNGIPIGSFLLWRTSKHMLNVYDSLGPFPIHVPGRDVGDLRQYLLDGHQRLATLYGALNTDPVLDGERGEWPIYFDLENERFRLASGTENPPRTWLPLSSLFAPKALIAFQKNLFNVRDGDDDEAQRAEQLADRSEELAERFKEYAIPLIPLVSEDLQQAIETFQRINKAGTPMSEVHMASAMTWSKTFDLNERLQSLIEEELSPIGWSLEPQDVLDAVKALFNLQVYKAKPEDLREVVTDRDKLEVVGQSLIRAVQFLRDDCKVGGPVLLPYRYQLIILAAAFHEAGMSISMPLRRALKRWFWLTTYHEYFRGMLDRGIRLATEHIRKVARGKAIPCPPDLRRDVEVPPMTTFRFNAARGKAFALQLLRNKPRDQAGGLLDPDLRGADGTPKIFSAVQLGSLPSDGPENRWIAPQGSVKAMRSVLLGDDEPDPDFLQSHLIPNKAVHALRRGRFDQFLALRREALVEQEQRFLRHVRAG